MPGLGSIIDRLLPGGAVRSREALLRLLAGYVGEERAAEIGDELDCGPAAGLRAPPAILCILFASRSGSNYAGRLLSNTPYFGEIAESFRPRQLEAVREREGLADCAAAAQWMIDNRGTPHAFGFKAGFNVLIGAAHLGVFPELLDRTSFLLLRRRDRVAQAVSLLKGELGGPMNTRQGEFREIGSGEYDAEAIADNVGRIRRNEAQLEDFAARLGQSAPLVHYEDICADPRGFVAETCRMLDLEPPAQLDIEVDLGVVRDEVSAEWCERFRAERPEFS